MKTMKKLFLLLNILISSLSYGDVKNEVNNVFTNSYENLILDSSKFFSIVDSLKNDQHIEFAVSEIMVNFSTEYEKNEILESLYNNIKPEKYIVMFYNNTYYPLTEYINEGTNKMFNNKYFYIKFNEDLFVYTIYYIRPSGSLN